MILNKIVPVSAIPVPFSYKEYIHCFGQLRHLTRRLLRAMQLGRLKDNGIKNERQIVLFVNY